MLRLLIFLLWVVFAAFAVTVLLTFGEAVKIEAFGWRMDVPAGVAGAALALLLAATALVVSLWNGWSALRRRSLLRAALKRREKGVAALVEAARAHQAADYRTSGRLAGKAAKLLDRDAIATLFAAPAPVEIELDLPPPEAETQPPVEEDRTALAPPAEEVSAPALIAQSPQPAPPDAGAVAPEQADAEDAQDRTIAAARQIS